MASCSLRDSVPLRQFVRSPPLPIARSTLSNSSGSCPPVVARRLPPDLSRLIHLPQSPTTGLPRPVCGAIEQEGGITLSTEPGLQKFLVRSARNCASWAGLAESRKSGVRKHTAYLV